MYYPYAYMPYVHPYAGYAYPGPAYAPSPYYRMQPVNPYYYYDRPNAVQGQATWTEGGEVTKCGIPWSTDDYMTVAVGKDAPYRCGQELHITNLSTPQQEEIKVTVVDEVPGYEPNQISLHREAFEELGVSPDVGVIQVEIEPAD
ncbi:RlpA-like double-psi beta-barrel domain-containing protein [Salsuginibacillus kocurii]|uniref:RlpA-like double-psi beta-barrel domain-containing protein n=1 Tax=Salsuginibacillus kocurii TaxID=427078 RepID=UPI00037216D7|nr:RlpA-like double-psi beta-barrel domain-containing protein [Salsuginibacillus kocurii]